MVAPGPLPGPNATRIDQATLPDLLGRVVDDARAVAAAEVNLYKAKAGERVAAYRSAATFFVAAAVLGLSALVAMLVGLILTLATIIGPGLATLAVMASVLLIAGFLAYIGRSRLASPPTDAGAAS